MSYTNTTDYLKLPQWVGSDHPTFASGKNQEQGDFNKAFSLIDTNAKGQAADIGTLKTTANNASSLASSANALASALSPRVDTLEDNFTDLQTTVSNVATDSASALAQSNTNATAITKLQSDLEATTKTANNASTTASSASSTASTANTNANTAKTNAQSALTKANTNASNIETLQSDLSSLQSSLSTLQTTVKNIVSMTDANFKSKALNILFPVGSIYFTVGTTSPQTLIGGTWTKLTANRYIKTTSSSANSTGGNTSVSLKLTERQTPWKQCGEEAKNFGLTNDKVQTQGAAYGFGDRVAVARNDVANQDAVSFNLDPSYITVIAWRRTA